MIGKRTRWNITPYVGGGPLHFGMTSREVGKFDDILGKPETSDHELSKILREAIKDNPDAAKILADSGLNLQDGEPVTERRPDLKCEYFDGRLGTIDFFPRGKVGLFINDIDLFNTETQGLLQQLEKANGGAQEYMGSVLFAKLGIILGGYYSSKSKKVYDTNDDRDVCIYSELALEKLLTMLKHPYKKVSFFPQVK